MRRLLISLIVILWPALAGAALDEPLTPHARVAFLGLTFIDTSTEGAYNGARADETARLAMLESYVVDRFEREGFVVPSNAPIADELANTTNPAKCNGCAGPMAERLSADYVLVGEVQKVSNLILSMNLVLSDARTGKVLRALAVDIRSNTDDSWRRGMRYIMSNHIFH